MINLQCNTQGEKVSNLEPRSYRVCMTVLSNYLLQGVNQGYTVVLEHICRTDVQNKSRFRLCHVNVPGSILCSFILGGSEKKEGEATAHCCILRCLTQLAFEEWKSTHALNMLRGLELCWSDHDYALQRICTFSSPYLSHQACTWAGFVSAIQWTTTRCRWLFARWEPPLFLTLFLFWLKLVTHRNRSECRYDSYECDEHASNGPPAASG